MAPQLAEIILRDGLTGLTLTGGEPTEQADALADLITRVRRLTAAEANAAPPDILMFTGLTAKAAQRRAAPLWELADAAVCGPYRQDRPRTTQLIATSNQKLVILTSLGAARFTQSNHSPRPTLQTHVNGGEITLIGLPNPGDLPRLEAALRARGITMEGRSWPTP